jgi:protease I
MVGRQTYKKGESIMKKVLLLLLFGIFATSATAADNIFSPASEESAPDGYVYDIAQIPAKDPNSLSGKRVAIIASHGVQEEELTYPYYFLKTRNAEVEIVVPSWTADKVILVRYMRPTKWVKATRTFAQAAGVKYDLVIVAGGAWSTAVVRKDKDALSLITGHYSGGGLLAAICTGPQVLIDAGLSTAGRITGSPTISTDLVNSGSEYTDEPVTESNCLITGKGPNDLPDFMLAIEKAMAKN